MSKYYHIKPIEQMTNSWRWFVDEAGLEYAKWRYKNYPNKNYSLSDRWAEFATEEVNKIYIDFGGMADLNCPNVKIKDDEIIYEMPVTHIDEFIYALKNNGEKYKNRGITSIIMKWWRVALSLDTGNRLLIMAMDLRKNCQEMIEGIERDQDKRLALINEDKIRIIRVKKDDK